MLNMPKLSLLSQKHRAAMNSHAKSPDFDDVEVMALEAITSMEQRMGLKFSQIDVGVMTSVFCAGYIKGSKAVGDEIIERLAL